MGRGDPLAFGEGAQEIATSHFYGRNLNLGIYRSGLRSENVQAFLSSEKAVSTTIEGRLRKLVLTWGAWVAPSAERPILDFTSGS